MENLLYRIQDITNNKQSQKYLQVIVQYRIEEEELFDQSDSLLYFKE